MRVYLDASVLTSLILFEPRLATVRQRLGDPSIEIVVSDLAAGETSAAIAAAARHGGHG